MIRFAVRFSKRGGLHIKTTQFCKFEEARLFLFTQNNQNCTSRQMGFSSKTCHVMIDCLDREGDSDIINEQMTCWRLTPPICLTLSRGTVHSGTQTGVCCSAGMLDPARIKSNEEENVIDKR